MTKIKVLKDRSCPICKSQIEVKEKRENNGILGPGRASWVVDIHGECVNNDCRIKVGVDDTEQTEEIEKK